MFRTFTDVTRPALPEQPAPTYVNRLYICDLCSDGWSSETEVEIHRSDSHSKVIAEMLNCQERSICKMCMTEFPDESTLLCHIKTQHLLSSKTAIRVEREIFICSDCGEIFFNKSLLVHHILKSHMPKTKNAALKCPLCWKKIRLNTCWYHYLHHKLQSVAVCKICLKKLKDRLALTEHMQSHPCLYKCDTCAYVTKKQELLDGHIHSIHKKPDVNIEAFDDKWMKYYMPKKQPKTWKRINLMGWKGVKLTNGVHICVLCREICVGVANMKRHILVDHMREQDTKTFYQCVCGMAFSSKVLYKHHIFKFKDEHML